MAKTIVFVLLGGLALTSRPAWAQASFDKPVIIDVNIGLQAPSRTLDSSTTFPMFGETAAVSARQNIAVAPILDARVGYRLTRRFAVALGVSRRRDESTGSALASVPSPIVFASPAVVSLEAPGLKRREIGYYPQLVWLLPVTDKISLGISGGPSFLAVRQSVMTATAGGTQNITVGSTAESGTAVGGNAGVDATYSLSDRYGVGIFARYAGASLDLPSATGVKVGGFQSGGGIRVRF